MLTALFVTSALFAREARANGTFPAVSQLVSEPGDATHLALRTTFGVVFSTDAGANWNWICEDALGYTNTLPAVALLPGGPLVLGVPAGITRTQLAACDVAPASGVTESVVDLSVLPQNSRGVIALSVDYVVHRSQVWESTDAGVSFAPLGDPLPDFVATTLDVAPSDPDTLYVSGMPTRSGAKGLLLRSEDHGKTFVEYEIPGSTGGAWPYIGAIDPTHADKVYVRLGEVPGRLEVTVNGGASFSERLRLDYEMQGFALAPDGKTVIVSSPAVGTFRADTETLDFEQVSCSGVSCMLWNSAGLFACGDQSIDGYVVGRSLDRGASFQRVLDFGCIQSDFGCASTTSVGSTCPALWPPIEMLLTGFGACDPNAPPPRVFNECLAGGAPSGGGPSTGVSSAGTSGAGVSGAGVSAAGASGAESVAQGGNSSGAKNCSGCSLTNTQGAAPAWLTLGLLLSYFILRRRQRNASATPMLSAKAARGAVRLLGTPHEQPPLVSALPGGVLPLPASACCPPLPLPATALTPPVVA